MLKSEQIESLFYFCEKHFIKYYDVQVELVDHLANAVETEMERDPKITFETALEKVHQSFGVMGFSPLITEKQIQEEKRNQKLFWKLFKEQFGWPKCLVFLICCSVFFTVFSFDPHSVNGVSAAIVIICWTMLMIGMLRSKRKIARTGKKFLIVYDSSVSLFLFILPVNFVNISNILNLFHRQVTFSYIKIGWIECGLSVFLSLYIVVFIALWGMIISVQENLRNTYPEVFSRAE